MKIFEVDLCESIEEKIIRDSSLAEKVRKFLLYELAGLLRPNITHRIRSDKTGQYAAKVMHKIFIRCLGKNSNDYSIDISGNTKASAWVLREMLAGNFMIDYLIVKNDNSLTNALAEYIILQRSIGGLPILNDMTAYQLKSEVSKAKESRNDFNEKLELEKGKARFANKLLIKFFSNDISDAYILGNLAAAIEFGRRLGNIVGSFCTSSSEARDSFDGYVSDGVIMMGIYIKDSSVRAEDRKWQVTEREFSNCPQVKNFQDFNQMFEGLFIEIRDSLIQKSDSILRELTENRNSSYYYSSRVEIMESLNGITRWQ